MSDTMPVAWIFMLFMVLMVGGAIAAIIWRSWIVGGIVLLFFVLVFGLYFVRVKTVESTAPAMVVLREGVATPSVRLEIDPETLKNATVYPSLDQGVRNLTLRLLDQIEQSQPAAPPKSLHIVAVKPTDRMVEVAKSILSDKFPRINVKVDNEHVAQPDELLVMLGIDESQKSQKCLKFSAHWNGRNYEPVETCVKDAPWVIDLDEYRLTHNGDFIVGSSQTPDVTEELARRQAKADVVNQMFTYVLQRYPSLSQANHGQWLRNKLENDLDQRKFNYKEFVQGLHLAATNQPVYRAFILVDVSPSQLDRLQGSVVREFNRKTDSVRHFSLGTMGLGVVICVVYLFLNWATRGYFQMNLRLGAFLVLIAGVLMLLMIG